MFDYSYDGVMRQVEESLHRLCTDRSDIRLIHDCDKQTHGADAQPAMFQEAMTGAYPALAQLRAEGVVRAIGVGVNEAEVCLAALQQADLDCILLAGRYTLLEQQPLDDLLPLCNERGVAVILGGVFNSGILAKGGVRGAQYNYEPAEDGVLARVAGLEQVCARHEVPLGAAAVQFAAAHPGVANVCLGARTVEQQEMNGSFFTYRIPPEFWVELKSSGLIRAGAPTPEGR